MVIDTLTGDRMGAASGGFAHNGCAFQIFQIVGKFFCSGKGALRGQHECGFLRQHRSRNVGQSPVLSGEVIFSSLPVPSAGSTTLSLVVPGEHTSVNISPGLITSRTSENGHTTVEATLAPGQPAVVWWATRETATPVVAREVRFLADLKTLVSVSEADLAVGVLADVTVVQGDPSQFDVEVPAGYEITGV